MKSKKTLYIIPGYRQTPQQKAYKQLRTIAKKEGFVPVPIKIDWKNTTISENVELFLKEYRKLSRKKKYILGFSYGAMIAFIASTKVPVSGLVLCSLSPYFKEDVLDKSSSSTLQQKRLDDFQQLSSKKLAKKIKAQQLVMTYGTQENRSLIKRVNSTYRVADVKAKNLIRIHKTEHTLGSPNYLKSIQEITRHLD